MLLKTLLLQGKSGFRHSKLISSFSARVKRNGEWRVVNSTELVPGGIVIFLAYEAWY